MVFVFTIIQPHPGADRPARIATAAAHLQTAYWKDSVSLWTHCLACTPGDYVAHNNLGIALVLQGRREEAIHNFERALEIKPDDSEAHNNSGVALASQGKMEEAIHQFERALELKADNSEARTNLGRALAARGASDKPSPSSQEP